MNCLCNTWTCQVTAHGLVKYWCILVHHCLFFCHKYDFIEKRVNLVLDLLSDTMLHYKHSIINLSSSIGNSLNTCFHITIIWTGCHSNIFISYLIQCFTINMIL